MEEHVIDFGPILQSLERAAEERAMDNRTAYNDERTCSNCSLHDDCWLDSSDHGLPRNFRYRAEWNGSRFINHMKSVLGQICASFSPTDIRSRRSYAQRMREAERRREGWDPEENT